MTDLSKVDYTKMRDCPLLDNNCLEENCVWYMRGMKTCVVHGINQNLRAIAEVIAERNVKEDKTTSEILVTKK